MQAENSDITIIYLTEVEDGIEEKSIQGCNLCLAKRSLSQGEYLKLLDGIETEKLILADGNRITKEALTAFIGRKIKEFDWKKIGYTLNKQSKSRFGNIQNLWSADPEIVTSPILMGCKSSFLKAYAGSDLGEVSLASIGYSLQKVGGVKFTPFQQEWGKKEVKKESPWKLWYTYTFCLPLNYLVSGQLFTQLFSSQGKVQRDMFFRFLFILFACFSFVFMPYISKDYGVTGDEFVDHRHAGYVLDYFAKGDKAALNQPKTTLHLYGNSVQVITAALCRWFEVDNYYELRHFVGGVVGALGILATGWMGLRWGGGLCGLLCMILMFFTPRFFGHSMNNLKDVPFAVGYMLSVFYTVRLFDYYPYFRLRHLLGLVLGIALALGTRSGGLVLYPMLLMYAGLFYLLHVGIREFYKFKQHSSIIERIITMVLIILVLSYVLAILLWPFALKHPLNGVVYSLTKFTNYGIGLRTIFDGEQMVSNMLPWRYAPQYLCIAMPIVVLIGFFLYLIYMVVRKKEFSLISFFLLFATIFPVYWVIHSQSNLYGGIRHMLFVMPPMVVLAGRFWSEIIHFTQRYVKLLSLCVFIALLYLPISHTLRNHPNQYVYFNEVVGGLKNVYGDYETDYYFNSLKNSAEWFKKEIVPTLPKDKKTVVATQAAEMVKYYFRHDTNIEVVYTRYYEKYAKDWDYAIFGNVYINPDQLKNGLFPPEGVLYAPTVDGFPMSFVMQRQTKAELAGFQLEKEKKYKEAIQVFETYLKEHPSNEEIYSKLGKMCYLTKDYTRAIGAFEQALSIHPVLNEALYLYALTSLELNDYEKAMEMVNRMLADNAISPEAKYLKAQVCYKMKNYKESMVVLNDLLRMIPNHEQGLLLVADIYSDNGDFQNAAQIYEQILKQTRSVEIATRMVDMWVRMELYEPAGDWLEQLKEFQDSYYPIYKVRCRMFLQQKRLKEADAELEKLKEIQDDVELFVLRAFYAYLNQDSDQAVQMLERALELEPANVEALQMMQRIR